MTGRPIRGNDRTRFRTQATHLSTLIPADELHAAIDAGLVAEFGPLTEETRP